MDIAIECAFRDRFSELEFTPISRARAFTNGSRKILDENGCNENVCNHALMLVARTRMSSINGMPVPDPSTRLPRGATSMLRVKSLVAADAARRRSSSIDDGSKAGALFMVSSLLKKDRTSVG